MIVVCDNNKMLFNIKLGVSDNSYFCVEEVVNVGGVEVKIIVSYDIVDMEIVYKLRIKKNKSEIDNKLLEMFEKDDRDVDVWFKKDGGSVFVGDNRIRIESEKSIDSLVKMFMGDVGNNYLKSMGKDSNDYKIWELGDVK